MRMALATLDTSALSGTRTSSHPSPPPADDIKLLSAPLSPLEGKPGLMQIEGLTISRSPSSLPLSPPSEHRTSPALPDDAELALSAEGPCTTTTLDMKMEELTTFSDASMMSRSPPAPSPPSLSASDTKACSQMLAELSKHASAWPFKTPVDPVLAGAPDYFDIIQRPMDLSTVERKLANFQYSEVQEFANDIQLMLNNCFTYNPPTNGVHQLGKSLESYFSLQLNKNFPTITTVSLAISADAAAKPTSIATSAATPGPGPRRASKRNIKAPKIFEPETIVLKKPKTSTAAGSNRRNSTSSHLAHEEDPETSEDEMGQRISTLASCLQTINQQLAMLTEKKKVKRKRTSITAVSTPIAPAVKRRKSKAQITRSASNSPSPMDLAESGAISVTGEKQCEYCATSETPMWRRGPSGCGTLCNKCGVKWRHGKILGDGKLPDAFLSGPKSPFGAKRKTPKKEAGLKTTKARGTAGRPRKTAKAITYEQKNELSTLISQLSEEHMGGVVEIIRSGLPHLRDTQEEIELDIETIDSSTLCALYDYVKKASSGRKPSLKAATTSASSGPRGLASDDEADESDDASSSDSD
ncbi:hypothetical protein PhCBS80983_g03420 [Powellomyces hirtus]|uniref:Bromo domain-containing protein n=1 Tax=Powellomyces hirtus TaxID=109895 RepID=A0A507E2L2_9FUNG|nr:hypothetical protein PhCBS80983_g03420 [Powellomyces hirtus]